MNPLATDFREVFAWPQPWLIRLIFAVLIVWASVGLFAIALQALRRRATSRMGTQYAAALVLPLAVVVIPAINLGWIDVRSARIEFPDDGPPKQQESFDRVRQNNPDFKISTTMPGASDLVPVTSSTNERVGDKETARSRSVPQPPTTKAASSATNRAVIWMFLLLAPMAWGVVRVIRSTANAGRWLRGTSEVDHPECLQTMCEVRSQLGGRGTVGLRQSESLLIPLSVGLWKPTIVLPARWRTWSSETLRAVLAHEMAHLIRRDLVWQLGARIVYAVYWFHPLAWFAAWRMRVERELACDDEVLRLGARPTEYAEVLLDLASRLRQARFVSASAVAMASSAELEVRIRAILAGNRRLPIGRRASRGMLFAALALLLLASSLSPCSRIVTPVAVAADPQASLAIGQNHGARAERVVKPKLTWKFRGTVQDSQGHPAAQITVTCISSRFRTTGRTAADGSFAIDLPENQQWEFIVVASNESGSQQAGITAESKSALQSMAPIRLKLEPPRVISAVVIDKGGKPVNGATVSVVSGYSARVASSSSEAAGNVRIKMPAHILPSCVYAFKDNAGLDYFLYRKPGGPAADPYHISTDDTRPLRFVLSGTSPVTVRVVDSNRKPLPGLSVRPGIFQLPNKGNRHDAANIGWLGDFDVLTDASGAARFAMIPINNQWQIDFWITTDDFVASDRTTFDPRGTAKEITAVLLPLVTVRGTVFEPNHGGPAAGAEVDVAGDGYRTDRFQATVKTASDGSFEVRVPPEMYFYFGAGNGKQASTVFKRVIRMGQSVERINLVLGPATRVHGDATLGPGREPIKGEYIGLQQDDGEPYYELPEGQRLPNPEGSHKGISPLIGRNVQTDAHGGYEFFVGPGSYYIFENPYGSGQKFQIEDQPDFQVNFHRELPEREPISGRVVLKSDHKSGIPEATIQGYPTETTGATLEAVSGQDGRFRSTRNPVDMLVHAKKQTGDGLLAGMTSVSAGERDFVIPVEPTASARGRLIVPQTGAPADHREIQYGVRVTHKDRSMQTLFGGHATTNNRGEFVLPGLVPRWPYEMLLVRHNGMNVIGLVTADKAGEISVGDIKVPKLP